MVELAKHIRFQPRTKDRKGLLEIDGVEFPWYVTHDGVEITSSTGELTIVQFKIPCEHAEVVDTPWLKPVGEQVAG